MLVFVRFCNQKLPERVPQWVMVPLCETLAIECFNPGSSYTETRVFGGMD